MDMPTNRQYIETEDGWVPVDPAVELIEPKVRWSPVVFRIALAWTGFVSGLVMGFGNTVA